MDPDGSSSGAEESRDLVESIPGVVVQNDRRTLAIRQPRERFEEIRGHGCGMVLDLGQRCEPRAMSQLGSSETERNLPDPRNDLTDRRGRRDGSSEGSATDSRAISGSPEYASSA